ncbi:hypothetical protein HDV05_005529 [Chytridiales sp. JEL 0842]|nr:hypothetical protein HDV05_005529 [Chytridiales sp. JEL 0842]
MQENVGPDDELHPIVVEDNQSKWYHDEERKSLDGGFEYKDDVGCRIDIALTVPKCAKLVSDNGFKYFGLEAGDNCYAASQAFFDIVADSVETCSTCRCPGNPRQTCGGSGLKIRMYTTTLEDFESIPGAQLSNPPTFGRYTYVGCFDDYSDRILRDAPIYVDPQMAIEKCHVRAQSMGAKHFGAERKVENKEYSVACAGSAGASIPEGTASITILVGMLGGSAPTASSGAASTNRSGGVNIATKTEEQGDLSTGTHHRWNPISVFLVVSLFIGGATYKLRQQKAART